MQVSVVQFSNDVRVELSPQLMPMEQLRDHLGEMVRLITRCTNQAVSLSVCQSAHDIIQQVLILQ